jgi:hypothetical protein
MKRSCSELVFTRRSTVLIPPFSKRSLVVSYAHIRFLKLTHKFVRGLIYELHKIYSLVETPRCLSNYPEIEIGPRQN